MISIENKHEQIEMHYSQSRFRAPRSIEIRDAGCSGICLAGEAKPFTLNIVNSEASESLGYF